MNEPVIQTKKSRTKYDKAFKQRAVELWLTSGKAATVSGRGVGDSSPAAPCLEGALRAAAPRGEGGGGAQRRAEQREAKITSLQRENDYLRQQRDIKKTLGILSEAPTNGISGLTR
jgi:transposase-like protein